MFEKLSEETQEAMKSAKKAAIKYSSWAQDPKDEVIDAILLDKESPIAVEAMMPGYEEGPVKVWFEFVTHGKSREEAERMASEACVVPEAVAEEVAEPVSDVPGEETL